MTGKQRQFDASHGQLLLGTGVTGRAAKMGHRLTIEMQSWEATVSWSGDRPTGAHLSVEVDSLQVLQGDGGLTPLTGPEKMLIRSNALKCLDSNKYRQVRFDCDDIEPTRDGYRLAGELEIHGRRKPHVMTVRITDDNGTWRIDGDSRVTHSDFGVKRYSMLMGAMQVADEVTVSLSATISTDTPTTA